jgi:hypothetical protein
VEERWTIQWLKQKAQTMIYKTPQRKLKIEQNGLHYMVLLPTFDIKIVCKQQQETSKSFISA